MRQGPNLLKLARKEQCLALLTQLRTKFKTDGFIYRVFPNGEVQYLHPKVRHSARSGEGRRVALHGGRRRRSCWLAAAAAGRFSFAAAATLALRQMEPWGTAPWPILSSQPLRAGGGVVSDGAAARACLTARHQPGEQNSGTHTAAAQPRCTAQRRRVPALPNPRLGSPAAAASPACSRPAGRRVPREGERGALWRQHQHAPHRPEHQPLADQVHRQDPRRVLGSPGRAMPACQRAGGGARRAQRPRPPPASSSPCAAAADHGGRGPPSMVVGGRRVSAERRHAAGCAHRPRHLQHF